MKKIIINENRWQTRIAVVRQDLLENLYLTAPRAQILERAYFKGTVAKILPGIQTAFVNIDQAKAGFLHISEIDRELSTKQMLDHIQDLEDEIETDADEKPREQKEQPRIAKSALDISKILKEGSPILVQVSKEPVYEKGAKLTTCFTLPGRFIVLMPNVPRIGISKKIENREERQRLRDLIKSLVPEGMGAIIRTGAENKPETTISTDVENLLKTWRTILANYEKAKPEEKIHEDIDPVLQVIRDHLDEDVASILCDTENSEQKVYKFVKNCAPEFSSKIKRYTGTQSIFEKYQLEKQIAQALDRKVRLASGGSLIIETTEAMTVIDVNTGRYIGQTQLEETLLKTNLEAAEEVVRQLKLRNIGGIIVIDFIDMATHANRQKLYRFLEKELKEHDKFQSVVLKVSEFGLVQMTRKRSGKTLSQIMTQTCQACQGLGNVMSIQTEAFTILRKLKERLSTGKVRTENLAPKQEQQKDSQKKIKTSSIKTVNLSVHPEILKFITTLEYNALLELEKAHQCTIILHSHEHPDRTVFNIWS